MNEMIIQAVTFFHPFLPSLAMREIKLCERDCRMAFWLDQGQIRFLSIL